ncbi:hypothetical protein WA026_001407 [Henosepilachna vigintioctopunctata]
MTYIQCNFCNAMVDADLYLLQICSTRIPSADFLNIAIENFHIKEWMSMSPYQTPQNSYLEGEHDAPMLESFLTCLATLVSVRTNLGLSETALNRLEMVTLLCTGDKTHSQLLEQMPERYGTSQSRDFEALLAEVADYRAPALEASGNMQQGMYVPKAQVWKEQYDPIHVLLRAVHRRDFQTSMDRYTEYAKHTNQLKPGMSPWPPFRTPTECGGAYEDPRSILKSRVFHAAALVILYKAVKGHVSEQVMALVVFLLEQAIIISRQTDGMAMDTKVCPSPSPMPSRQLRDMELTDWFKSDNIFENLAATIHKVVLTPEPEVSPMNYSSDSESEWGETDMDSEMLDMNMLIFDPEWAPQSGSVVPWSDASSSSVSQNEGLLDLTVATPVPTITTPEGSHELPAPTVLPALMAGNEVGRNPSAQSSSGSGSRGYSTALVRKRLSSRNNPASHNPPPIDATPLSASSTDLVPSTSKSHRKNYPCRRRPTIEGTSSASTVKLNESIISLLLKLHSNLSGTPDSFVLEEELSQDINEEAMIGDGPFFIGKLLKRMALADDNCKRCIAEVRSRLWPTQEKQEQEKKVRETKEREERRKRAKERQQKLMAEFASKQKQFMEKMESNEGADEMEEDARLSKQEYDCAICGQSTPSTEEKPMGLVVLVQATSVIGHRRRHDPASLPVSDEEKLLLRRDDTLASEFDRRIEELDRHFDPQSWFLSVNSGWDGGVHVQTCGHHLHLDCLNAYLRSLRSQQRQPSLSPEKGEYLCPLCRQLANSVLPLSPQLGECSQIVRSRPTCMAQVLDELSDFLRESDPKPNVSTMSEAIGKAMEDMSSCTQLKPIFKLQNDKPTPHSLFLFITSIARTNLEVELIQRGGSLVVQDEPPNPLLPKRDCIVPLLHVLSVHARVARGLAKWAAWTTFEQLCGLPTQDMAAAIVPIEREVPLLLRDPVALLLQFVLLLPLHLDQIYLTTTVQMVYNLLYYQVIAQVSLGLSFSEMHRVSRKTGDDEPIVDLAGALGLIDQFLGHTNLYIYEDDLMESKPQVNIVALEQQVQRLCLPFLRIATLLKYHLYRQPLPVIQNAQSEFVRLVYYLELVTEPMDWDRFNAAVALNWPAVPKLHRASPESWCRQLEAFSSKSQIVARSMLADQHVRWQPPRLLQLPREYEKIFTYYHERTCSQCHSVPQETSICLLCGTIVCLKQSCCKQQNVCEAVFHALECGAGTGVFLVVTSTYIIVIRGHRACLWGSLYLDEYEEEDRDLKRGKPLYLSQDRYKLLEQQWLAHRFDHTKKNWVQHRNAL